MQRMRGFDLTVVWTFLLAGLLGLVDALVNLSLGGLPQPAATAGVLTSLVSAFALAGWLGAVVGALALLPLSLLLGRRGDQGRSWAMALAMGAGAGVLVAVVLGGHLHGTAAALWWRETLGTLWIPRMLLAAFVALIVGALVRPLVRILTAAPAPISLAPVLIMLWATLSTPRGHSLGEAHHLAGLEASRAPTGAPNLILLSIDALRRDKLSCLADDAPATPHLDALAARGRLFTNAWSASPWTLPSVAAMHTGAPPRVLGVNRDTGLPPSTVTLAQTAYQAGWYTSAVVANPFLGEAHGLPRGFAHFDHADVLESLSPSMLSTVAREATRYVLAAADPVEGMNLVNATASWLEDRPADQPFFLWVHFMEPHLPYRVREGSPTPPDHPLFTPEGFADLDGLRAQLPDVPSEIMATVESLYDGEVRHADRCVGRLLDILNQTGELDRSWVVVLSDHGEEFFEHGGFEHGHSLMPEVTGIPLMIIPPRGHAAEPAVDHRAVSLLDLVPSLCQAMGWPVPNEAVGRPSLVPDADGRYHAPTPLTVIENLLYGPPQQATLRWPDFRLTSPAVSWYRLDRDPGAQQPVAAPFDSALVDRDTRALTGAWDAANRRLSAGGTASARLDDAAKRRLESLGY